MPCKKIRYPSVISAKLAISSFRGDERKSRMPSQFYWCKDCKGYHLTSRKKKTGG